MTQSATLQATDDVAEGMDGSSTSLLGVLMNKRREPNYQLVAREMRTRILQGDFNNGERLPTEVELATFYAVSRQTIRRAFQDLVTEGMVYRVPGRGTFARGRSDGYIRQVGSVDDLTSPRGEPGQKEVTVRYLTPHSKWSIHSEYQDNLLMLSLSRGGPTLWISQQDAAAIGVSDNEWVEAVNRNGVLVARAIVTHRLPAGMVFVYHAQERVVNVPIAHASGKRGGIHNSLTRVLVKPTHLIGGYAQLSFAFNYLGPTGNQRDEVTVVRRRSQEVSY